MSTTKELIDWLGRQVKMAEKEECPNAAASLEAVAQHLKELEAQLADAKQVANDCRIVADNAIAEAAKNQWQPIETAPKDGAVVLVSNNDGIWVAKYHPVYQSGYKPDNPWSSMLLNHNHIKTRNSSIPTHWMPLPAAPAIQAEGKQA